MKTAILLFLLSFPFSISAQFTGSVTQGQGTTTTANLMPNCPSNHVTPLGSITSTDSKVWIVPAETSFSTGPFTSDLHNQCNNKMPANLAAANLGSVPVTEIDANGEIVTGYLFADNYFELYINGILVGVDPVPFTPFNSCVVKFKVSRPYTIAVKLVDWEENPGLGSEIQGADNYHPGDGGFIAQFSDGTVTNANWKAQTFYISPLMSSSVVQELADGTRSTANTTNAPTCNANCFGVHYDIPSDWKSPSFSDNGWPGAKLYTAAQVTNQAAYTNFASTAWGNASFIWSSNLILDNLVLARYIVPALTSVVAEKPGKLEWKILPNPGKGFISISLEGQRKTSCIGQINITNILGESVLKQISPEEKIDISTLSPGLYFVGIEIENERFTKRLVIE